MNGTPHDWNIVLVGAWNLAILTPDGIARRMFGLSSGTAVEVQVALDQPAPLRVVVNQIMVVPSKGTLTIQPLEANIDSLLTASNAAIRILNDLPETPLRAAGVNFKYRFATISETLQSSLKSSLDDSLIDAGFSLKNRQIKRSIQLTDQSLNIIIEEDQDMAGLLHFNFHNQSNSSSVLASWLSDVRSMNDTVHSIMDTIKVKVQENSDAQ